MWTSGPILEYSCPYVLGFGNTTLNKWPLVPSVILLTSPSVLTHLSLRTPFLKGLTIISDQTARQVGSQEVFA